MAVYAIGDVQGCFPSLLSLLNKLSFRPETDTLWFTGDLVNRGPQSLEVLRFVSALPNTVVVLGNHDLHLLAVASGQAPVKKHDSFDAILAAPDREALLAWLRQRPLLHHDPRVNYTLVHAGLLPQWDLAMAQQLAREAEHYIERADHNELYTHMYGDTPDHWQNDLGGWARIRIIINAFTRLRYTDRHGRMDLRPKMTPGQQPAGLMPWFEIPDRLSRSARIVFGHWSTLGLLNRDNILALDSGCLWGGRLTAVRLDLEDPVFLSEACPEYYSLNS